MPFKPSAVTSHEPADGFASGFTTKAPLSSNSASISDLTFAVAGTNFFHSPPERSLTKKPLASSARRRKVCFSPGRRALRWARPESASARRRQALFPRRLGRQLLAPRFGAKAIKLFGRVNVDFPIPHRGRSERFALERCVAENFGRLFAGLDHVKALVAHRDVKLAISIDRRGMELVSAEFWRQFTAPVFGSMAQSSPTLFTK